MDLCPQCKTRERNAPEPGSFLVDGEPVEGFFLCRECWDEAVEEFAKLCDERDAMRARGVPEKMVQRIMLEKVKRREIAERARLRGEG